MTFPGTHERLDFCGLVAPSYLCLAYAFSAKIDSFSERERRSSFEGLLIVFVLLEASCPGKPGGGGF